MKDGGFGLAAASGLVLQGLVEYFGLHRGQWSSGGLRIHVSHVTHVVTFQFLAETSASLRSDMLVLLSVGECIEFNETIFFFFFMI